MISESSPLHNILDTGRFRKKFKDINLIGEGGFGKVYKATYHIDQKPYAIKVVRLHIKKTNDPLAEIYQHRVYRELQTTSKMTSENIVRYYSCWFEELDPEERASELKYKSDFLKVIDGKKEQMPFQLSSSLKKKRSKRKSMSSASSSSLSS